MKTSLIVWDLETVPDIGEFAVANDLVGKSDVEVREAIGEKFPEHIYHSIVGIGALIAHRDGRVDAVINQGVMGTGAGSPISNPRPCSTNSVSPTASAVDSHAYRAGRRPWLSTRPKDVAT